MHRIVRLGSFTCRFHNDNVENAVTQVKVSQQLEGFDNENLTESNYDTDDYLDNKLASVPNLSVTELTVHQCIHINHSIIPENVP
jgi:hypothetical protein